MKSCNHATATQIADSPIPLSVGNGAPPRGALILNLARRKLYEPVLTARGVTIPASLQRQSIEFEWPDGGVPGLARGEWQDLAAWLAAQRREVFVACVGGHGRTGTAATILVCLWEQIAPDICPVTWLRERYCKESVETKAQIDYIAAMTGRTVTAKPSHDILGFQTGATTPYCDKRVGKNQFCWRQPGHPGACDSDMPRPIHGGAGAGVLKPVKPAMKPAILTPHEQRKFECGAPVNGGTCNRFPGHASECFRLPTPNPHTT